MPSGRYPERVKDFKKWSAGLVDKAKLTGSATNLALLRKRAIRRKRRKRAKKAQD